MSPFSPNKKSSAEDASGCSVATVDVVDLYRPEETETMVLVERGGMPARRRALREEERNMMAVGSSAARGGGWQRDDDGDCLID